MEQLKKFLKFNDKVISFLSVNGTYYVAIKPICEALNINYNRQFKNLKDDKILGQLLAKQPMTGADNKTYLMQSLPEKYIYGWLFSINSDNQLLQEYKIKCYDLLYDYFHGSVVQRIAVLRDQVEVKKRIVEIKAALSILPEFLELQKLEGRQLNNGKTLKDLDNQVIQTELKFFD